MKKIIKTLLVVMVVVLALTAFVACNKEEEPCNHSEVFSAAVNPTCTEVGYSASSYCSKCGEVFIAKIEIPALGHTWDDATCTEPKTCSVCAETEGEALGHKFDLTTGVCACGHVNTLAVGNTNKIIVTDQMDNGYGYYISWVPFVVTEEATYAFAGENLVCWIYDSTFTNNLCGMTGMAKLTEGTYYVCVAYNALATVGEFNVAVTKMYVVSTAEELVAALAKGGNIVLAADITVSEQLNVVADTAIYGNGHTLTSTVSTRAIDVQAEGANLTIDNLTLNLTASWIERGINYNTNGTLTLNKVTIEVVSVNYTVNLPDKSDECKVVINESNLEGFIVLNVWGANSKIAIVNSELNSNIVADGGACIAVNHTYNNAADGSTITVTGGKLCAATTEEDGKESNLAVRNYANNATVTVSDTTEVTGDVVNTPIIAGVHYPNTDNFYSFLDLQDAVDVCAEGLASGAYVVIYTDITLDELTVPCNVTIETGDYTLTVTNKTVTHDYSDGYCTRTDCGAVDPDYYFSMTIAEALTQADGWNVQVSGTVSKINTPWNDEFDNITVTITDGNGNTLQLYRLATKVEAGDIITVKCTIDVYNGKYSTEQGATATVDGHDSAYEYKQMTVTEVLAAADNTNVIVTGTIVKIDSAYSSQYKNISVIIAGDNGDQLLVYRLSGGSDLTVGDIITVTGTKITYNGTKEIEAGATYTRVGTHTCANYTEATCTEASKCVVCGTVQEGSEALEHDWSNGVCARENCDETCTHAGVEAGAVCGVCGLTVTTSTPTPTAYYLVCGNSAAYWTGVVNSGKGATSTNKEDAVLVYKEETDNGFYLYILDGTDKKYITIGTSSTSMNLSTTGGDVLEIDSTYNTVRKKDGRGLAFYNSTDIRTYAVGNSNFATDGSKSVKLVVAE